MMRVFLKLQKNILVGVALTCLSTPVWAEPSKAADAPDGLLTLKEAVEEAYLTNPTIEAARAEAKGAQEALPQAKAGWRPQLSASADLTASRKTAGSVTQTATTSTPTAQLSYNLFQGWSTQAGIIQAEKSVLAADCSLRSTVQSILLQVIQSYLSVWTNRQVLEFTKKNETFNRNTLEATKIRFEAGDVARTELEVAKSTLAEATARRIAAEGDVISAEAGYRALLRHDVPKVMETPVLLAALPATYEEALDIALKNNPDLLKAQYSQEVAQEGITIAESKLWPSLDASASAGYNKDWRYGATNGGQYQAGLNVKVPLDIAGATQSSVRQAKLDHQKKKIDVQAARLAVEKAVTEAWEKYQVSQAKKKQYKAQVKATKVAYRGIVEEANHGLRSLLDVQKVSQDYLQAQVSFVQAQQDETVAAYTLLQVLGILTSETLNLGVKDTSVKRYHDRVENAWFQGLSIDDEDMAMDAA